MGGYVYILADFRRGRTYIGVTNDLVRRVYEHREGVVEGYTKKNNIKRLVYFEEHAEIEAAIQRETLLKRWYRRWKETLIEEGILIGGICGMRLRCEGVQRWSVALGALKAQFAKAALSVEPSGQARG